MTLLSLWARRRRLAGTAVAVVLGVAFLSGTLVLGDTLGANFDRLFAEVSTGTDVVIRNENPVEATDGPDEDRGLIDGSMLDTVSAVDGVADAEGQVVGFGQLLGSDGEAVGGNGPPRLAGSWIRNPALNPYTLVEGRPPEGTGEVVVNRGAAADADLAVGDTTTVQAPQPVEVTIVGIATFGDADGLGETTWTAWSLDGAQEHVTGQPDRVSTILVQAEDGTPSEVLRDRIRAAVPDGMDVITGAELAGERSDEIGETFLDRLRMFLVVFAGIALVVAALSIANSFSVTVAQRTRELALLRAVGASRRQVRRLVSAEALLLGTVSAAVGALAGLGVAGALKGVFDAFGFALPAGGLVIRPASVGAAAGVGMVTTLLAAQMPARRASAVAPVAALRSSGAEPVRVSRTRWVAGGVAGLVGLVLVGVATASGSLPVMAPAAAGLVAATLLLGPAALTPVAALIGQVLRRLGGASGRLAEENTRRNPRRSTATATALVIGVTVVTLFTVFAASLKLTMEQDLDTDFGADLAVNTPAFGGGQLDPGLTSDLEDLPEVDRAVGLGQGNVGLPGGTTVATTTDLSRVGSVARLETVAGDLDRTGPTDLAVSRSRAGDEGWRVGDHVELTFGDGSRDEVRVAAVYEDNEIVGDLVIPAELWAAHTAQPTNRTVLLTLAAGVTGDEARAAVEPLAGRYGGDVQDREEYAGAAVQGFDLLLGVVYVLLALAIVIALLGIGNTLSLAVHERRREIGLLRAVGQTRRQARSVLRLESLILATFGTLVGLALGALLGWALFATVVSGEGSASFALPVGRLAVVAAVGALAGVLAARRPARRAARLPVLDAIASE